MERDLPEPTINPGETAFDSFSREVEAEAAADPTGQAGAELQGFRDHFASEAERLAAERGAAMEKAWGFPPGTGEAARQLMSDMDDDAEFEEAEDD